MNRIGIFDDHPLIAKGIAQVVTQKNYAVPFLAHTHTELMRLLGENQIDILILDIVAPDITGIELFEEIRKKFPHIKLIAYSSLKNNILAESLFQTGVLGYVNKQQFESELITAIQHVSAGNHYFPSEFDFLFNRFRDTTPVLLTDREVEIIKLIASEFTTKEIATKLFISEKTVENHRHNIFDKLKVKNLAGLILAAIQNGYLC